MEHVHSGGCGCADEMKGDLDLFSLNDTIAVRSIQCLNEAKPDSGKSCLLCPYEHRSALVVEQQQQSKDGNNNDEDDNKTTTPTYQLLSKQLLTSECDNEVIFNFNFQDEVKIKAFLLTTPINNLTPKTLRVFVNPAVPLDFSTLSGAKPTQQWQCYYDPAGEKTMITRGAAFSRVNHIALHLSGLLRDKTVPNPTSRSPQEVALLNAHGLDGVSHDQFVVGFLGVLGNYTGTHRGVVKDLKYEAVPSADDHPVQQDAFAKKGLGFGL